MAGQPAYSWLQSAIPASRRGGGVAVPNITGSQYAPALAQMSRSKADREINALNTGAQVSTANGQMRSAAQRDVMNALANLANTEMVSDAKTYGDRVALDQLDKQYELDQKAMGLGGNPWMKGLAALAPAAAGMIWKPKRPDLPAPPGLPTDPPATTAPGIAPGLAVDPAFTVEVPGEGYRFDPNIRTDAAIWKLPAGTTSQFQYDPIQFDVNGFDFRTPPPSGLFSQAALWGAG